MHAGSEGVHASDLFSIGLREAPLDGILLRYWRVDTSGRDQRENMWESCSRPKFGIRPAFAQSEQRAAEHFARRVDRATARAARNGRSASKAKVTHHASGETSKKGT